MNRNKLPADPSSLVLSIIALVLVMPGCCVFPVAFVALIMGIVALVEANKSMDIYRLYPTRYLLESKSNVFTSKVLSIISIVLSSVIITFYLLYWLFSSSILFSLLPEYERIIKERESTVEEYHWEQEYIDYEQDETIENTIYIDSLE